jgi:hypothetical protein
MIPSLRGQLDLVRPHLVPRICSEADFRAVQDLGDELPVVATSGFEYAMKRPRRGVDLSIAFRRPQPAGRYLASDDGVGTRVRALLAAAADPGSKLYDAFGVYWLEFDTSMGERRPSLFAGPRAAEPSDVIIRASEIVLDAPLAPVVRRAVARWSAPRSGVKLFQAGWMLGRPRPGLRLCFCTAEAETMQALIAEMTSGEQRDLLVDACRRYADLTSEIALAVDVGEGEIAPRVGLELGFRGWKPEQSLPRWGDLLDRLVAENLCSRSDCRALLSWPGRMNEQSAAGAWPVHLRGAGTLLGPYRAHIARALNHVKLVAQQGVMTDAKAYLVVLQTWARA